MLAVSSLSSVAGFIGDQYYQYHHAVFVYSDPSLEQYTRQLERDSTSSNMGTDVLSNYSHYESQGRRPVSARTVTDFSRTKHSGSQRAYDKYSGAMIRAPGMEYEVSAPSYVRSPPPSTASATHRPGFVPDMPPPDYFISGASRHDSKMFRQAYMSYSNTPPSRRLKDPGSRAMSQYSRGRQRIRAIDDVAFDDTRSVAPEDSISQVSSNRTHRSKNTIRSMQRHSVMSSEYNSEDLWAEDEQRYFDPVNGYWVRDVRPYYTRM